MTPEWQFILRICDEGEHGLLPNQELAFQDEAACRSAANAFSRLFASMVAFSIQTDGDGCEELKLLGRYGRTHLTRPCV